MGKSTVKSSVKSTVKSTVKSKKTKITITDDKKKQLALAVKKHPALWNIADLSYKKRDVVASCWDKVSEIIDLEVSECKKQWKCLKDSLNYRLKSKIGKSGDSGSDNDDNDDLEAADQNDTDVQNSLTSWALWEDLKFVTDNKPKRKTISTILEEETASTQESILETSSDEAGPAPKTIESKDTPKMMASNYDYMLSTKKSRHADSKDEESKPILNAITELVQIRKDAAKGSSQSSRKFEAPLNNLERLLNKVPEIVAEDLCMRFYQQAYDEVKKYANTM
ncbi:hypothetical protein Fcan01_00704 [Folsomia candida]|uniref:MADF domain-containing protein n=1 Tax=Folsomia candida TaxID=158441 RepID=A0A226F6U0_FOLCA|nr:hypothetical protein Fcan01_00704 [Folsomia candida]